MTALAPLEMLECVAAALGESLVAETAFVGGCVVPLLVTDPVVAGRSRTTDDVDLIVEAVGHAEWYRLAEALRQRGFHEAQNEDVICRMRIQGLAVDFMPVDSRILGFTNRWYADALASAAWYTLGSGRQVRCVHPIYFIATKIEAFEGRGDGDFLGSRDMEDILALLDGRDAVEQEIFEAAPELQAFIAGKMGVFLRSNDFEYAVQSTAREPGREDVLFGRIEGMARAMP